MITVKLALQDESDAEIVYPDVIQLLHDIGLRRLFDAQHIGACTVLVNNRRVFGLPVCSWERMTEAVKSNGSALLRATN